MFDFEFIKKYIKVQYNLGNLAVQLSDMSSNLAILTYTYQYVFIYKITIINNKTLDKTK